MEIRTTTIERLRDALLQSGIRRSAVTSSAYRTLAREGLLTDKENETIHRVAVPAETMFLVIAADQQITDTELAALRGAIRGLAGDSLSDDILHIMLESYAKQLQEQGLAKRLQALSQGLDKSEALNTFALAAAAAIADDQLADEENETLCQVRDAFSLTQEEVKAVLGDLAQDS